MSGQAPRTGGSGWEHSRSARLLAGLVDHARTAWWGLVAPRTREREPLVVVQAVVLRAGAGEGERGDREVLLALRRELLGWELPGGTPLPGESLASAVVREVAEETGILIACEGEIGRFVRRGFRPHTAVVFRARAVGGALAPSAETPRVGWFSAAAPPDALFPWFRTPLERALVGAPGDAPCLVEEWQGVGAVLAGLRIDLALRWRGLD